MHQSINKIDASKLKVGIFTPLINGFIQQTHNYNYSLDIEVKKGVDATISSIKQSGIQLVNLGGSSSSNNPLFSKIFESLYSMAANFVICMQACLKFSYNQYFGNRARFDFDSPYHNFNDILNNPKLLSKISLDIFNLAALSKNDSQCIDSNECISFDSMQKTLIQLLKSADYDALLMATFNYLPYLHDDYKMGSVNETGFDIFYLSTFPKFPVISIPTWFSTKEGLPVGMMLISRPDRFENTLQIARLIKRDKHFDQLPINTPLIRNNLQDPHCL